MKKLVKIRPLVWISALALVSGVAFAEGLEEGAIKHKEKSTIDNFPFQALEQDDLAEAVIAGGLEPTSAGEDSEALTPGLGDQLDVEVRDKQTDLGRSEVSITFNYREPRFSPGVEVKQATQFMGNRTYHQYDSTIQAR